MKKYCIAGFIILLAFTFSSCLKDKNIEDQKYGLKGLEDIDLVELTGAPARRVSLISSNTDTSFNIVTVHLNSESPAAHDITVTLSQDAALLDAYNEENGTDYQIPPSSAYTLDNLTVTIPKGSREASVKISTKSANLAGAEYAFPFTIVSISDPNYVLSKNYKSIVTIVGVKNQFDGVYSVTGTFVDLTSPAFSGDYPKDVSLVTEGSFTNSYLDGDLGNYGYVFYTGTGYSYFGNWAPVFTFDADGNVTKVSNYYSDPPPRSRDSQLDTSPGTVNKYDFATKTLDVSYYFMQGGAIRGKIHEIWTYKGPR
jgi:hypothetical protein